MILRTGMTSLSKIFNSARLSASGAGSVRGVTNSVKSCAADSVAITPLRRRILEKYCSSAQKTSLFKFDKTGEITTLERVYGSEDLMFLEHIKNGRYVQPKMNPEGTIGLSKEALAQSNRLSSETILESEQLVNGFRYNGPHAVFDSAGKNISRFRSGPQEITIIDRNLDATLNKTIETFKNRISKKNLTEEEKIDELMKFVDEVFSVSPSGKGTEALVENMHSMELREVFLGEIINSGAGVCRHRSLLTKVLGDEIGLKTRLLHGKYASGGHAWNEIITRNGETILFDSMHGNMFNVSNTSKNVVPQVFNYKVTNPNNSDLLIQKYFDPNSQVGYIYRYLAHKQPINTSVGKLIPSGEGYTILPSAADIKVNGKTIVGETEVFAGDWVQIKDLSFQII